MKRTDRRRRKCGAGLGTDMKEHISVYMLSYVQHVNLAKSVFVCPCKLTGLMT